MNCIDIQFPVITFSYPNVITFNTDMIHLTSCSKQALKNGYYKNLKIVDSNGNLFVVNNATKIKNIGPFWGYNIFLGQRIQVELEFNNDIKILTLNELKRMVSGTFKKGRDFWDSGGNYFQLQKIVYSAESIPSLIHKIGEILNAEY